MYARNTAKKGFTLIEILIVVIILGILAAIVIPQFSSASSDAKKAALRSTVQTLRSQIALYKLQHGDTLPDLAGAGGWATLTAPSTYQGTPVGPYMQAIPVNSLTNGSAVKDGNNVTTPNADFVYDYNGGAGSGNIWGTTDTATGVILP